MSHHIVPCHIPHPIITFHHPIPSHYHITFHPIAFHHPTHPIPSHPIITHHITSRHPIPSCHITTSPWHDIILICHIISYHAKYPIPSSDSTIPSHLNITSHHIAFHHPIPSHQSIPPHHHASHHVIPSHPVASSHHHGMISY